MGFLAQLLQKKEEDTQPKQSSFAEALKKVEPAAPIINQKIESGQTLSRADLHNLGVTERTNAQQRKVITDTLKRKGSPFVAAGMGGGFTSLEQVPEPKIVTQTKKAWQRGGQSINVDFLWNKVAAGQLDEAAARKAEKQFEEISKKDPVAGRNWLENLWLETVQVARPMAEGTLKGLKYGTAAGTTAAVAGQMGPQAAFPEELVTVPGAFVGGQVVGSVKYWTEQGRGSIYRQARKQGLSQKVAGYASAAGGPLYAFIEYSQVDKIIPGMGKIKGNILKKALRIGKNAVHEVFEEGAQKIVTDGAVAIGELVEGKIKGADVPEKTKEILGNAWEEMKQAAGPMAVLQIPGATVAMGETIAERGQQKQTAKIKAMRDALEKMDHATPSEVTPAAQGPVGAATPAAGPRTPGIPPTTPTGQIVPSGAVKTPSGIPPQVIPAPTEAAAEVQPVVAQKAEEVSGKRIRQPAKPTPEQIGVGETFGLTEKDVTNRLHKAQLRYEELRSSPEADLTTKQKTELDFLRRKRTDIPALLGRDIKPLSREAIEARAQQHGVPFRGRTTKAILEDVQVRAAEQRARKEVTGSIEWRKGEPVNVTPDKLLEYSLKHEAKGAKAGYRAGRMDVLAEKKEALHEAKIGRKRGFVAGQEDMVKKHNQLLEFAKETLPEGEYKLVVRAASRAVKSRTPAEINKVIKAVNKMVENYEKASVVKDVREILKSAKNAKLRPEFQEKVDAIADGFITNKSKVETLKRFESLLKAAELDDIGEIPQRLIDKAKDILSKAQIAVDETGKEIVEYNRPLLASLEPDELRTISAAIGNIIKMNQRKNQFLSGKAAALDSKGNRRTRTDVIDEANKSVLDAWGVEPEEAATLKKEKVGKYEVEVGKGKWDANDIRLFRFLRQVALGQQLSLDTYADLLGGEDGIIREILYKNVAGRDNKQIDIMHDFAKWMDPVLKKHGIDSKKGLKLWQDAKKHGIEIELPEARTEAGVRVKSIVMSKDELVDFLTLVKDPNRRAELLRDKMEGIRLHRDGKKGHSAKITADDLRAIVEAAPDDVKEISQAWHDYVNDLAEGSKYKVGQEVADEWLNQHGYPLARRPGYATSERYGAALDKASPDPMGDFQKSYLEDMNMLKPLTGSNAPFVIRGGFSRMITQISRMATYASKATALDDAFQLLYDRSFQETVSKTFNHGEEILSYFEKSLRKFQGMDAVDRGAIQKLIHSMTPRMHVGALIGKPYIVMYQPASLLNATNADMRLTDMLNPMHMRRSELKRMRQLLNENSPQLLAREESSGSQIMNPVQAENSVDDFFGFGKKRLRLIHGADSRTISLIGLAAEAEGKRMGKTGEALAEYIARRTEDVVARTQPTWDPLTISQLAIEGRDNPVVHQLVMFSSQRSKNTNTMVREMGRYIREKKMGGKPAKARVAKTVATTLIAQNILIWAIRAAYFAGLVGVAKKLGYKPKEYKKTWTDRAIEITGQMLGNWLVMGDVADLVLQKASGTKPVGARERGTVAGEMLWDTGETIAYLRKTLLEYASGEKYAKGTPHEGESKAYYDFMRTLDVAAQAAGVWTGLPFQSIVTHARPFMPQSQEPEKKTSGRGTRARRK